MDSSCPHCLPIGVPETLSHMLLGCPVAQAVWEWVARQFAALSGRTAPPLTVAVLLADDLSSWQPLPVLQTVWTQLRIATLAAITSGARSKRKGRPVSAHSVAATVVHSMRTAIHRDWQRVTAGSPEQLTAGICCSSWLRGRHPFLTMDDFRQSWAHLGSWCTVVDQPSGSRLQVSLSYP